MCNWPSVIKKVELMLNRRGFWKWKGVLLRKIVKALDCAGWKLKREITVIHENSTGERNYRLGCQLLRIKARAGKRISNEAGFCLGKQQDKNIPVWQMMVKALTCPIIFSSSGCQGHGFNLCRGHSLNKSQTWWSLWVSNNSEYSVII